MKIWMLTFESKRTVKIGGLGEVPPSLGEALVKKSHDVEIIMPSHGVILNNAFTSKHKLSLVFEKENYKAYRVDDITPPHILLSSNILDNKKVYDQDILYEKIRDYAKAVSIYAIHALKTNNVPDIIHCNDWHTIPSLLILKTILGNKTRFLYQIHLLSHKRITGLDPQSLGISLGVRIPIKINGTQKTLSLREIIDLAHNDLERLGCILADVIATVSKHYLVDILSYVGWELKDKATVIYNGTDWSLEKIYKENIINNPLFSNKLSSDPLKDRKTIRDTLLTRLNEMFDTNEPIISNRDAETIVRSVDKYPFMGRGRLYPFTKTGPLAIMTGRLTEQKGWSIFIKALDTLLFRVPEARILLFPLPVGGHIDLMKTIIDYARIYRDNIRPVFGIAKKLFVTAHIAADVMAAPSLFEPFGIMALEAMASGTPVVASRTGGLSETILDIREHGVLGTGILVNPGSPTELAKALSNMLLFMEAGYIKPWSPKWKRLIERIDDEELSNLLLKNPEAPWKIRESCIRRAREFSWDAAARMAEKAYEKALM